MTLQDPLHNDPEARRARNRRSLAIAAGLILFIAVVFLVTVARIGGNIADRSF